MRVFIVAAMLTVALVVNVITNIHLPAPLGRVPVLGLSVWAVLLLAAPLRRPDSGSDARDVQGHDLSGRACYGSFDDARRQTTRCVMADSARSRVRLGRVGQDTTHAFALKQGGYDWGYLRYAVGFGGSMTGSVRRPV